MLRIRNTYNVGSSDVHFIMVLLCLSCSGNLRLILNLEKGDNQNKTVTQLVCIESR